MARVTVEDCIDKVESWFELVMLAAQRSREITSGAPLTVEKDGDKPTVIALREIAAETVSPDNLRQSLIRSMQKVTENEEVDQVSQAFMDMDGNMREDADDFSDMPMRFEDESFSSSAMDSYPQNKLPPED